LTTLWEQNFWRPKIIISYDKTTIAIHDKSLIKGWLLSFDNNCSCSTQQFNFEGNDDVPLLLRFFTPDDECIVYATNDGLRYWSVVERKFIDNKKYLLYTMNNGLTVANCSPSNRQLIVRDDNKEGDYLYMKSIF